MPATDIKRIYEAIKAKRKTFSDDFNYYDGDQPVMYSTQALRDVFRNLDARFTLNICAVVIDAVKERMAFKGFATKNEKLNTQLHDLVVEQDLLNEADETHEAALVTGEAFVIVWPELVDGQETGKAEVFYNDPRNVAIFYDPANPKKASFAGKMWCDDAMFHHLTVYYPDHLEYYKTQKAAEEGMSTDMDENSFIPDLERAGVSKSDAQINWPENPYAPDLPVFHFQVEKRAVKSDIKNVIPLQNGMNKLMADLMITSEFMAWPQRYIISNADTKTLQVKPGTILDLPGGVAGEQDTSAGEFGAAQLTNYTNSVDKFIGYVSSITNTPKHYFDPSSDAPSGEALITMEAPLNKKAQDRIDKFMPVWARVASFALRVMGQTVNPQDITAVFDKPETIQPKTEAEIVKSLVDSGMPLEAALAHVGWSKAAIDAMTEIKNKQAEADKANAAKAALQAQRDFKAQTMPTGVGTFPVGSGQLSAVSGQQGMSNQATGNPARINGGMANV